jgi:hypothetical protein
VSHEQGGVFASGADLLPVLIEVELQAALRYTLTGNFEGTPAPIQFDRAADLPQLGIANYDSAVACTGYLVTEAAASVEVRHLATTDGPRWLIDQLANGDSVTLRAGGARGPNTLLSGLIATASDTPVARALMQRYRKAVRKRFVKVRSYLVGPEAQKLLAAGGRLTAALQSPPEYDLRA